MSSLNVIPGDGIEVAPRRRSFPAETGVLVVLTILITAFTIRFPEARNGSTVSVILTNISEISIVAAGMTLVIATGGIDVSVGSIVGLCGVVLGKLSVESHMPLAIAIPITLLVGCMCGWINGTLISRFKLPPIIATLAMLSAARAGAYVLSHGTSISGLPDSLTNFGYGSVAGIPTVALLAGAGWRELGPGARRGGLCRFRGGACHGRSDCPRWCHRHRAAARQV